MKYKRDIKIVTYIILMIAYGVLFMLNIIPHHHHQGNICFNRTHCSEHNCNNPDNNHHHDKERGSDSCVLNIPIEFTDKALKSTIYQHLNKHPISEFYNILFSHNFIESEQKKSEQIIVTQPTLNYFFDFFPSIGLRAPPII